MAFIAQLYAASLVFMVVTAVLGWASVTAAGGRVKAISLGGKLVTRRVGDLTLTFGLWPGGAQLTVLGDDDGDPVDDPRHWSRLGFVRRFGALAAPWLAL